MATKLDTTPVQRYHIWAGSGKKIKINKINPQVFIHRKMIQSFTVRGFVFPASHLCLFVS